MPFSWHWHEWQNKHAFARKTNLCWSAIMLCSYGATQCHSKIRNEQKQLRWKQILLSANLWIIQTFFTRHTSHISTENFIYSAVKDILIVSVIYGSRLCFCLFGKRMMSKKGEQRSFSNGPLRDRWEQRAQSVAEQCKQEAQWKEKSALKGWVLFLIHSASCTKNKTLVSTLTIQYEPRKL